MPGSETDIKTDYRDVCPGFIQSVQEMPGSFFKLCTDGFLPLPFQLYINWPII